MGAYRHAANVDDGPEAEPPVLMVPPDAQIKVKAAVDALSAGDYAGAVRAVDASRCSLADLKRVVDRYGRTLTAPPDTDWDVIAFAPPAPRGWSVHAPLWSAEEGRSDLELRFTVERRDEALHVTLDDLLVP